MLCIYICVCVELEYSGGGEGGMRRFAPQNMYSTRHVHTEKYQRVCVFFSWHAFCHPGYDDDMILFSCDHGWIAGKYAHKIKCHQY